MVKGEFISMKKRLISFVVAMAMMFSLMGMTTMAAPAADILATDFSLYLKL